MMEMASRQADRWANWAGIALLSVVLLVYLLTLDNGFQAQELIGGDLITHQYAQVEARPGNAPGYPLYTMGGWIWFHALRALQFNSGPIPANPIPLLSGYSTLWALLALWLFYRIACRVTRRAGQPAGNWPLAWLLGLFYALTYFFWYYATTTEQYSSAIAHMLAIVYLYLLWQERADTFTGVESAGQSMRLLYLLAFLCGLTLAHMLTIAFIVPGLVLVILWQAPWLLRSARAILGSIAAAALPLVSYLYVYWRGAAHPEWWGNGDWPDAQAWFWSFVSTAQGREELGWGFEPGRAFFGNGFPGLIWQELSLPLLIIGLIGIACSGRRLSIVLYATIALTLIFSWAYRYGNWFQVILPIYPLILLGSGLFLDRLQALVEAKGSEWPPWRYRVLHAAPLLLLAAAIIWRGSASLPSADSRNRPEDTALDRALNLIDQQLPPDSRLFAGVNDALALQYLIEIWGIRDDLEVISSRSAGRQLLAGGEVLVSEEMVPTLLEELPAELAPSLQSASFDWILVQANDGRGTTAKQSVGMIVDREIGEGLVLHGYSAQSGEIHESESSAPSPVVDLTLFWTLDRADWPQGLSISVRPMSNAGFIPLPDDPTGAIIQQDISRPARGHLRPGNLEAGHPLQDAYRLPAPQPIDGFTILLYRSTETGFENVAEIRLPYPVQNQEE